jgi:hypothetical protein
VLLPFPLAASISLATADAAAAAAADVVVAADVGGEVLGFDVEVVEAEFESNKAFRFISSLVTSVSPFLLLLK